MTYVLPKDNGPGYYYPGNFTISIHPLEWIKLSKNRMKTIIWWQDITNVKIKENVK